MKFTWGHAAIAMPVTIVVVFTFVLIRSFSDEHSIDLVTDDYYAKEMKFQENIDQTKNAESLNSELSWNKEGSNMVLGLAGDFNPTDAVGILNVFRPSDSGLDFSLPISLDSIGNQYISVDRFKYGTYQIQVEWTVDSTTCYLEKNIFIQ